MASLEGRKIQEGMIIGTVKTYMRGSECDFEICSVETWESLSDEEADHIAIEAMNESGMFEVWW
jgi:hypothetical protein